VLPEHPDRAVAGTGRSHHVAAALVLARRANPQYNEAAARASKHGLTDLTNHPAPASPVSRFSKPENRMALRATLDITPTALVPPSPFPASRGRSTNDGPTT
jgi:hypothetical protein